MSHAFAIYAVLALAATGFFFLKIVGSSSGFGTP